MESEEQDEYSGSGASSPEKSEASLSSESVHVDENSGNLKISIPPTQSVITQKESCMNYDSCNYPKSRNHLVTAEEDRIHESAIDNNNFGVLPAKEASKDSGHLHCDDNTHMCGSEMMDARSNSLEGATGMVAVVSPVRDQYSQEASGDSNLEEEISQTDMVPEENNEQMLSRLSRSPDAEIKSKSLSPDIDSKSGNKRPAIICDFFARGWCIKGSSCRFVHKKDHVDGNMRPPDEEVAVVVSKSEMELVDGSKDVSERSRLPGFPESLASSAGNYDACSSPFSLQRALILEHGGTQRFQLNDKHKFSSLERGDSTSRIPLDHQLLASLKGDPGCISSFKEVDRERLRHMFPTNENHSSLINRASSPLSGNNLFHENGSGSSDSVIALRTNHHGASSYASIFGELACNGRQFIHNDSSPSLKLNLNTSLLNPAIMSSRHLRKSFSPLNAAPSHVQKLLDSDRDFASRSASLMQSTSPFSASKPECLSPTKGSRDPLHCDEFKSRIPEYNWEPSVPFRPSFFIPPSISCTGSLYDPLRDSIDESNVGDTSTVNTSQQHTCQNSGLFGTQGIIDGNIANHSLSSHNRINDNALDKSSQKHENGFLLTGIEKVGTSDVDQQSGTLAGEENPSGPLNIGCDATNQSHGARQKKDKRVDQTRQNNEVEIESKRDRDMPKESKALRHLRSALVDMVKDLLKPTWHEGRLSKDAHNVIVKKAVEKVLSTLQPHQISTMESMKQYLSLSQPKIAKLVEAYVEKYGKS